MKSLLILIFVLAAMPAMAEEKVAVHVFVKTEPGGFVDSSRLLDTANDLADIINKRKGMAFAPSKEDAVITLEVITSGQILVNQTQTQVTRGILGGINSTTKQQTLPGIVAKLRVNGTEYEKELSHIQQMFWKDLAKRIVDQLENWIKVNRNSLPKSKLQ